MYQHQSGNVTFASNLYLFPYNVFSRKEGGYGILSYVYDSNNVYREINPTCLSLLQTGSEDKQIEKKLFNLTQEAFETPVIIFQVRCVVKDSTYNCLILSYDQQFILAEIDYMESIHDFIIRTKKSLSLFIEYQSYIEVYPTSELDFIIYFYLPASKLQNLILFNNEVTDLNRSEFHGENRLEFYGGYLKLPSYLGLEPVNWIINGNQLIIVNDENNSTWNLKSLDISPFIPESK